MNRTFSETKLEAMLSGLDTAKTPRVYARQPVHMLTLAAGRFDADTSRRMGEDALSSIDSYAPDFVSFARAMWLTGADTLPRYDDLAQELEFELIENPENVKGKNYAAWFAWTIYQRTIEKLHARAGRGDSDRPYGQFMPPPLQIISPRPFWMAHGRHLPVCAYLP